jgi:integrase
MPSITDTEIRRALKCVKQTGKQKNLVDGEGRGTGRLLLVLKPMPTRVTASWMVQQFWGRKRIKKKIGSYPAMPVATARKIFARDFAGTIQKGQSIKIAGPGKAGTVGELFETYVANLRAAERSSWREVEKGLNKIVDTLGRHRPAREIEPEEVVDVIRPIYNRGARSMADHVRSYVRSAYSWGLKSEHDYRTTSPHRFYLEDNPAARIPTEPNTPGTRWLDEEEFATLYRWLENPDVSVSPSYTRAVRMLMLSGQRVDEIARLRAGQWDAEDRLLDWSRTKNGNPHAIPLPEIAVELLNDIEPNAEGWFFPSPTDPMLPVTAGALHSFIWRQRQRGVIPIVTNRDLRRTWKTLAGKAGISKDIRDRIQNHALGDVSSRHYDRWSYMPEKRAAMNKWDAYVRGLLQRKAFKQAA